MACTDAKGAQEPNSGDITPIGDSSVASGGTGDPLPVGSDSTADASNTVGAGGSAVGSKPDAATPVVAADAGDAAVSPPVGTPHVYVGGYGADITHFTLDLESGTLTKQGTVSGGTSPSYLAIAPNKRSLYAVNEGSGSSSQVIAFAIDPVSGTLAEINRVASGGDGAPHLAVHPSGAHVAVAHYGSGHVSLLPVRADGGLQAAVDIDRGPSDDCRKAHQAVFDASGLHLLVPCLETNYVLVFELSGGTLGYAGPPTVAVAGGPRHVALDPTGQHAYVLSELGSLITSFAYDAANGALSAPQSIDSQQSTKGASAHIVVHSSGKFLYASNRTENSLGLFSIDADGRPHPVAFETDGITTPRDFTIDPTGRYLIVANQNGAQDLRVYSIAPNDGRLTHIETVAVGGNPTCVSMVLL